MVDDFPPIATWGIGCVALTFISGFSVIAAEYGVIEVAIAIVGTVVFITVVPYAIGAIIVTIGGLRYGD